jgi:catechol 2,3-dioxygenase-like lactoylglutathione lyase family enzyme
MNATRINHVSIVVRDMAESIGFYEDLLGARRVPTAKFSQGNVVWLTLGSTQLHLFESDGGDDPTLHHHLGIDVEDFDAVYAKAKERGLLDTHSFGSALRSHPMGWVQMYLRDPAGNLVEIDWPDVESLDPATRADIVPLESAVPQDGDAAVATLYHS